MHISTIDIKTCRLYILRACAHARTLREEILAFARRLCDIRTDDNIRAYYDPQDIDTLHESGGAGADKPTCITRHNAIVPIAGSFTQSISMNKRNPKK